jgi:hypothetical protein
MEEYLGVKKPSLSAVRAASALAKAMGPEYSATITQVITPEVEPCIVYYGLRADETRTGYVPLSGSMITPKYPLIEQGIDLAGVYAILDRYDLAPPNFFWPALYAAVKERLDVVLPNWEEQLTRMERDVLFAGRTRGNCYFCFWQRAYEWVWLRDVHYNLFQRAQAFEGVGSDYSWRSDWPLSALDDETKRNDILMRRVKWVCGQVAKKCQLNLFDEETDNEIAGTSCGLLCGK